MEIKTITEGKRGCGFRKKGGLYLFSGAAWDDCGMLPIPLHVCTACGQGIKPLRGFGWISPGLWEGKICAFGSECKNCAPFFDSDIKKVGIMWVGSRFYPSADKFMEESRELGVSKRISMVPKELVVGKTWIMLAHRKPEPHIFATFVPHEIQYVVKDTDTPAYLESLKKRGITPVNVKYKDKPMEPGDHYKLFEEDV